MLSVATRELRPSALSVPSSRAGASEIGSANENVDPTPSSDSTQIRPPCCSSDVAGDRRARAPCRRPRTRARSTL